MKALNLIYNHKLPLICLFICLSIAALWHLVGHPIVAVILCLIPLGGYMVLKNPFLMVLAFIVFSFFRLHEVFPMLMPLKIPLLLALGSIVSISWNVFLTKKIKPFISNELITFGIFFVLVAIGILFATNPDVSMNIMTETYVKIAIMVFSISWMATKKELYPLIFKVFCLCGIIVGTVALYNKVNGIDLVEGTRVSIGRSVGSMLGDPNDLSLVLLFPAGFALSLLSSPQQKLTDRILGLITISIVFCAIIATQSRGGLLGIMTVFGVFGWFKVKNKALLITVGMIGLVGLFALAGVADRASGGAHEEGIDESAMGRIYAWEAGFKMAVARPLTGVGINNFYYNYYIYSAFWDGKNHAVHSTWFGVLAETGFLGFIAFATLIGLTLRGLFYCVRTSKRLIKENNPKTALLFSMSMALLSAFSGFMVSGTFLTMGFTWPLYIILSLSIALKKAVEIQHAKLLSK